MRTILVPLDGSQLAEGALPAAQMFASLLQARIHLLRAVPDDVDEPIEAERAMLYAYGGPLAITLERERTAVERAHRHAEAYLSMEAQCLQQAGFPATYDAFGGDPAPLITDCAATDHAALIAMTTHGYSGLRRLALGSVADKVVHTSQVPVLLLRNGGPAPALARPPRRILVPLDGSEHAQAALTFALDLARRAGAGLVLFHALTPLADYTPGLRYALGEQEYDRQQAALRTLDALIAQFGTPDVAARPVVTFGSAADEIARVAAWEQPDLIVMATHGRSGVARWALGGVADAVLHASEVPLVLVRPQTS